MRAADCCVAAELDAVGRVVGAPAGQPGEQQAVQADGRGRVLTRRNRPPPAHDRRRRRGWSAPSARSTRWRPATLRALYRVCRPRSPWSRRSRPATDAASGPLSSASDDGRPTPSRMSCSCIQQSKSRTRMNRPKLSGPTGVGVGAFQSSTDMSFKRLRPIGGHRAEPLVQRAAGFGAQVTNPAFVGHSDVVAHMVQRRDIEISVGCNSAPAARIRCRRCGRPRCAHTSRAAASAFAIAAQTTRSATHPSCPRCRTDPTTRRTCRER